MLRFHNGHTKEETLLRNAYTRTLPPPFRDRGNGMRRKKMSVFILSGALLMKECILVFLLCHCGCGVVMLFLFPRLFGDPL